MYRCIYTAVAIRGRFYERHIRRSRNIPEQLVVLKYPNFRLRFATLQNFNRKLGYFSTTKCSGECVSHKICPWCVFVCVTRAHRVHTVWSRPQEVLHSLWSCTVILLSVVLELWTDSGGGHVQSGGVKLWRGWSCEGHTTHIALTLGVNGRNLA